MKMALALVAALTLTAGDSQPVAKKDLPAPVLAAFQKAYPTAKLKACSSEQRDGKTCYELESKDGKTERDLIYAAFMPYCHPNRRMVRRSLSARSPHSN